MQQQFKTTRWSLVLAAQQGSTPEAHAALSTLCQLYWYPLYAFIRRQGHGPEDAHDLAQGFFTRMLEKRPFAGADQKRGRFRSWLLGALQHYLSNVRDAERALKRGGGQNPLSLDSVAAENQYRFLEPVDELTPERLFERQWALALLERVLALVREEYVRRGKEPLFDVLKGTLQGEASESSYEELAARLGCRPGTLKVAAHRLRRSYRRLLREEIAQTVDSPEDIEDELRNLLAALG
jgi:RNA polymerase sigma-70 factor (ECF subfamily)